MFFSKFHKTVLTFAKSNLPENAAVVYAEVLGEYGCFGFNSFDPFKLIGGIAKGHPDQSDIDSAVKFYESLL